MNSDIQVGLECSKQMSQTVYIYIYQQAVSVEEAVYDGSKRRRYWAGL